jgi:hypothetical protein
MVESESSTRKDLSSNRASALLLWGVPIAVLSAGGFTGPDLRTVLWTGALLQMSIACLLNAWRCGRMHCYFTGVFFLLGAVATPAYRFGFLPLGTDGWDLLGYSILIGGITLRYLPEWLWGSYASD